MAVITGPAARSVAQQQRARPRCVLLVVALFAMVLIACTGRLSAFVAGTPDSVVASSDAIATLATSGPFGCYRCLRRSPALEAAAVIQACNPQSWARRWDAWCGASGRQQLPPYARMDDVGGARLDGSPQAADSLTTVTDDSLGVVVFSGGLCFDTGGGPPRPRVGWAKGSPKEAGWVLGGEDEDLGRVSRGKGLQEFWSWLRAGVFGPPPPASSMCHPRTPEGTSSIALVIPIEGKAGSLAHAYYVVQSAMRAMRESYGGNWREDLRGRFTLLLAASPAGLAALQHANAFAPFLRLLAPRWVPLVTRGVEPPFKLCFDTVHVLRVSRRRIGSMATFDPLPALHQKHGRRTDREKVDARHFRREFGALHLPKADLPDTARATAPKVVIVTRRETRRFIGWAKVEDAVRDYARDKLGARQVIAMEPTSATPRQWVAALGDADVLIGATGSALIALGPLMPRGAVIVELLLDSTACAFEREGWDRSPRCDVGGGAVAASHRHLAVRAGSNATGEALQCRGFGANDAFIGVSTWHAILDAAACRLRATDAAEECAVAAALDSGPTSCA